MNRVDSPSGPTPGPSAARVDHDPDCLFCKIAHGQLPSRKVYEDDQILAFHDIHPAAPVHFLIIPKRHLVNLYDAGESEAPLLGRMLGLCGRLAREQGAVDGFRTTVNTGRVGRQEVYHLHIHVIGGPDPVGTGR